jgi:hypothetical protein
MTNQEVRTFTAAIILAGQYAEGDSVSRDIMVQEAIRTTDVLLEGLNDMEPLKKRITEWSEKRRKGSTPPEPIKTRLWATQDFIDRLPEEDKKLYRPLPKVTA